MADVPMEVFCIKDKGRLYECQLLHSRISELEAKLKVAEAALTYFKFRGATPEQKAYAMEALAKIKEPS